MHHALDTRDLVAQARENRSQMYRQKSYLENGLPGSKDILKRFDGTESITSESSDTCGDKFWKLSGLLALRLFLCSSILLPPTMVYIGIKYHHCDAIFPPWMIIGAVFWYLDCILCGFYKKGCYNNFSVYLIIAITVLLVIWWVFGFSRIFGPARSALRGYDLDLGIYDDPMMDDAECKLYMFTFNFWLCLLPFIFIGMFFIVLVIYTILP